jgi:hypothetical protein
MQNSRRQFMILSAAALGYKANVTTLDKAKYRKYVSGPGWCSADAKKA